MTICVVEEVVPGTSPIVQEFTLTEDIPLERIRLHLCFININRTSNPGSLTLQIFDDADTLLATKTQTFDEIKQSDTIDTFKAALDSDTAKWHGQVSFIFTNVNLVAGTYTFELTGSYTYETENKYVGVIKAHEDLVYPWEGIDDYTYISELPVDYKLYSWQPIRD